jgi:hypothetical protein
MKTPKVYFVALLSVSIVLGWTSLGMAGPALDITKGPVLPDTSWTGPSHDPHATDGQWFLDLQTNQEECSNYEFYDNLAGYGGGTAGAGAIYGNVVFVTQSNTGNITDFIMNVSVTNDTGGTGAWLDGSNSHNEILSTDQQYQGTMYDAKLTLEFAADLFSLNNWLATAGNNPDNTPYNVDAPIITASNPDALAWYCWTPDNQEDLTPYGGYLVPTYNLGDIAPGETKDLTIAFHVSDEGLPQNDPRHAIIMSQEIEDLFINRTTSLKVSNWIETLAVDDYSVPYPGLDTGTLSSTVSVFFTVPEPSTLTLLVIGLGFGLGLLWKKVRR